MADKSDPELPRKLIRALMEQGLMPDKELIVVVAMDSKGNVRVGSYSPIPITPELLQAALIEGCEVLENPDVKHSSQKIEVGKA